MHVRKIVVTRRSIAADRYGAIQSYVSALAKLVSDDSPDICWCVGITRACHMLVCWQDSDLCLTTLPSFPEVLALLGLVIC